MFSLQTLTYPLNTNILNNFGGIEANYLLTVTNIEEDENNELRIIDNSFYYTADELIIHFRSVTSNFIVLSLNIQSINSKYDQFVTFLDILNAQNIRIDAICLQETWLGANDSSSLYQLDNYHCIFKPKTIIIVFSNLNTVVPMQGWQFIYSKHMNTKFLIYHVIQTYGRAY